MAVSSHWSASEANRVVIENQGTVTTRDAWPYPYGVLYLPLMAFVQMLMDPPRPNLGQSTETVFDTGDSCGPCWRVFTSISSCACSPCPYKIRACCDTRQQAHFQPARHVFCVCASMRCNGFISDHRSAIAAKGISSLLFPIHIQISSPDHLRCPSIHYLIFIHRTSISFLIFSPAK